VQLERDRSVLDNGAYVFNFKGCSQCKRKDLLVIVRHERTEKNDREDVTYVHQCECGHEVATHVYSFECTETQHIYSMECGLCGFGSDEKDWQ
jgi:hypothetical protein